MKNTKAFALCVKMKQMNVAIDFIWRRKKKGKRIHRFLPTVQMFSMRYWNRISTVFLRVIIMVRCIESSINLLSFIRNEQISVFWKIFI